MRWESITAQPAMVRAIAQASMVAPPARHSAAHDPIAVIP
jgi:hypothetical protein